MKNKKIQETLESKYIETLDFKERYIKYSQGELIETSGPRIKIDTGFRCNASCYFCYYRNGINDEIIPSKDVIIEINQAKELGFKRIEFSGGESSIHPDFLRWIKYSSDLDLIPSTVTNALAFYDFNYLDDAIDLGLTELLISIHGSKNTHDQVIDPQHKLSFSPYQNILNIFKNYSHKIKIRFNITISNKNILELKNIIENLNNINTSGAQIEINLLPLNLWSDAKDLKTLKYNEMHSKYFIEALELLEKYRNTFFIHYETFCNIPEKFHKNILTHYDHFFTENDWYPLFTFKEDINRIWELCQERGTLFLEDIDLQEELFRSHMKRVRISSQYSKDITDEKVCLFCEKASICDGFKKSIQ